MGPSDERQVKRAVVAKAQQARADAARFAEKLDDEAFWRFRKRRQINRAMVRAKEREEAAIKLLRDEP